MSSGFHCERIFMILKQMQWPGPGWSRIYVRFIRCARTGREIPVSPEDVFWMRD
jgi:hypothetical protein